MDGLWWKTLLNMGWFGGTIIFGNTHISPLKWTTKKWSKLRTSQYLTVTLQDQLLKKKQGILGGYGGAGPMLKHDHWRNRGNIILVILKKTSWLFNKECLRWRTESPSRYIFETGYLLQSPRQNIKILQDFSHSSESRIHRLCLLHFFTTVILLIEEIKSTSW